jgi:hypothetical protein
MNTLMTGTTFPFFGKIAALAHLRQTEPKLIIGHAKPDRRLYEMRSPLCYASVLGRVMYGLKAEA